ncbi:MAG: hypothetical protein WA628_20505 [Terriglobales bacterium]
MKKTIILFIAALVLLILFTPVALSAQTGQEPQKITVKSRAVSNGVVILAAQDAKNSFELQCNKDLTGCTALEPGDYLMIRLPKNRGMYDCANAEVYRKSANSEVDNKLGQYCLVQAR